MNEYMIIYRYVDGDYGIIFGLPENTEQLFPKSPNCGDDNTVNAVKLYGER